MPPSRPPAAAKERLMNIPFTPEEFRTLLDMIYIADTVIYGYESHDEAKTKACWDVEQKILALARDFGCEDQVQFNNAYKAFYVTREYENTAAAGEFLESYGDNVFWDELVDRLAQRDIERHFTEDELLAMTFDERNAKEEEYRSRYWDDFEKNGLDHVTVTPHPLRHGPGWRAN